MSRLHAFFLLLTAMVMAGPPLAAHHGRGATFDMKKQLTLKGTVSQVKWQNPHVLISIDVTDEAGQVVTWTFENSNVHTLATHPRRNHWLERVYGAPPLARYRPRRSWSC